MFWLGLIIGCFIGAVIVYFTATLCAASIGDSMDNYVYRGRAEEK